MVKRYEIDEMHKGIRINDATQFHVSYTLFTEDGHKEKYVSAPIYARDELEAFMYFKDRMERKHEL